MTNKLSLISKFPAKIISLSLLGLVIYLVWSGLSNKPASSNKQPEKANVRSRLEGDSSGRSESSIKADDLARAENIDSKNKTNLSPDELANRVTKAANSLFILLKRDERSRARLVDQRVSNGKNIYSFEVQRNNDLDSFVRSAIEEIATRDDVEPLAIRASIDQKLRQFDIPMGKLQEVSIVVPAEPNKKISFSSFNREIGTTKGDLKNISSLVTGSVPLSAEGWRFDNLVESPKSSNEE